MTHTPHELAADFPGQAALIRRLRIEDAHFARLAERYHEINGAVHRAETGVDPMDPTHETELRKERMRLKDEIAALLSAAATA